MAIKKSEIYSRLWESCDALRGGMDASQYKDYVLSMLFLKYVSDKAKTPFYGIQIPTGASFEDAVALKGNSNIGDHLNKDIFEKIAEANNLPKFANFNDEEKLGKDTEKRDRLDKLIGIFQNLDFSGNRAVGDDILGDAYEYLMRNFATQSGKSKGQFYTPAEVSRVIAGILGIAKANPSPKTTVYDPTCGSGSLLLKVADAANAAISLYGQEKDIATVALAKMNMVLHGFNTAEILGGNTLASPAFTENGRLKRFDYVVANPPFSDKEWSMGLVPEEDPWLRFQNGVPPSKNGDFAYLLHIIASLKHNGKAVCVLPHGVLFRGNAESALRKWLVRQGYIKGIAGLPANLFYGTGIPACLICIDKENALSRRGIFMLDASKGFAKDGPKNRLRERDIHLITETFEKFSEIPGYARLVSFEEIEKNDFNLNLPRYIDNAQKETRQDIEAHLRGGIPKKDIDELSQWWEIIPKESFFRDDPARPAYALLNCEIEDVKTIIENSSQFNGWLDTLKNAFIKWAELNKPEMEKFDFNDRPSNFRKKFSESLLAHFQGLPFLADNSPFDPYEPYQNFLNYWESELQDDCWCISQAGWKPEVSKSYTTGKNPKLKSWQCELIPKNIILEKYFKKEYQKITEMREDRDNLETELAALEEEDFNREDAVLPLKIDRDEIDRGNTRLTSLIDKVAVKSLLKECSLLPEKETLQKWLDTYEKLDKLKKQIKELENELDALVCQKIENLSEDEAKKLIIEDKWLASLQSIIDEGINNLSHRFINSLTELLERYKTPLTELEAKVKGYEQKVNGHLAKMGFKWL